MVNDKQSPTSTRRKFLGGAAVASVATVMAPSVVKAQGPISMRFQSTWPSKDIFHEYALDFGKKVNDMTGGDLKIEVLPAGAVVPAFGLLDAVSKGVLDGGHGVLVYHYGKNTALALWGSGPGYGMDANMLLAWHKYGGGKALLEKIYATIGADVRSFPYAPLYSQPLGWFKKPMQSVDDFKGLKYRTVGISIDLFTAMGAAVNALPGGEIVAAIDRGLLDAAEFNNASSDRALGFADVSKICMLQSYHQNSQLQQDEVRRAAGETQGDHRRGRRSLFAGHAVEGDRPQLAGLHHAANAGQGEILQDAGLDPQAAA
jgi:TRAP-type mannitol/chloroaromatic compound transport system substrate-binding protein